MPHLVVTGQTVFSTGVRIPKYFGQLGPCPHGSGSMEDPWKLHSLSLVTKHNLAALSHSVLAYIGYQISACHDRYLNIRCQAACWL